MQEVNSAGTNTTEPNVEQKEIVIGKTTYRVITKYIGEKPFLDHIKAAIKRDVETAIHTREDIDKPA